MDLGLAQGHDINIRKQEGTSAKAFARKEGDAVWSVDRPGSLHVIPSKYETAAQFLRQHVSYYYKKEKNTHTAETKPPRKNKKPRSDKGCTKKKGTRAKETKPRKKGAGRPKKTYTLPTQTQRITNWFN